MPLLETLFQICTSYEFCPLKRLGCPSEAVVATVKHHKGRLESDITKDVDSNTIAALQTTEASCARVISRSIVQVSSGDGDGGARNAKGEAGKLGAAVKGVTTL